jgi:uncharacterized membrane protein
MADQDQKLEVAMGNMLRVGVTVAALVVLAGGILYLLQAGPSTPDYSHFRGAPAAYEHIVPIVTGAFQLDSKSLIEFGILLLIATPVCRVIFGVIGFSAEKDLFYAGVSTVVLAVLLLSFLTKR